MSDLTLTPFISRMVPGVRYTHVVDIGSCTPTALSVRFATHHGKVSGFVEVTARLVDLFGFSRIINKPLDTWDFSLLLGRPVGSVLGHFKFKCNTIVDNEFYTMQFNHMVAALHGILVTEMIYHGPRNKGPAIYGWRPLRADLPSDIQINNQVNGPIDQFYSGELIRAERLDAKIDRIISLNSSKLPKIVLKNKDNKVVPVPVISVCVDKGDESVSSIFKLFQDSKPVDFDLEIVEGAFPLPDVSVKTEVRVYPKIHGITFNNPVNYILENRKGLVATETFQLAENTQSRHGSVIPTYCDLFLINIRKSENFGKMDQINGAPAAVLFAVHSKTGRLHHAHECVLKDLAMWKCDIILINSGKDDGSIQKRSFELGASCYIHKADHGRDFASWIVACYVVHDMLKSCRWLCFINDSLMGPFSSTLGLKKELEESGWDLWALTESFAPLYHLQTSMFAVSGDFFGAFWAFAKQYGFPNDRRSVVEQGEINMTQFLLQYHPNISIYAPYSKLVSEWFTHADKVLSTASLQDGRQPTADLDRLTAYYQNLKNLLNLRLPTNPQHTFSRVLLETFKYPFLKKEILYKNPENIPDIVDLSNFIDEDYKQDITKSIHQEILIHSRLTPPIT